MTNPNGKWGTLNSVEPTSPSGDFKDGQRTNVSAKRDQKGRFLTGNNGGGRRKGSRNKLTDTVLSAIESDFSEHGQDTLAKLRVADPASYLRIIASLLPRDLIFKREQTEDYSDISIEEFQELMKRERQNALIAKSIERAKQGN